MNETDQIQETLHSFTESFQSLMISSLTEHGEPYASYAPFVKVKDAYYIIISKIAKHYKNMLNHPKITILFLEDEAQAEHIFFRKRLSYLVQTMFSENELIKQAFINKFGDFVSRLFKMDFVVVKCEVIKGQFIIGAGKAYEINQHQEIIRQMTGNQGKGHSVHK